MSAQPPNHNKKRSADVAGLADQQPKKTRGIKINTKKIGSNTVTGGSSFRGFSEPPSTELTEKLNSRQTESTILVQAEEIDRNDIVADHRFDSSPQDAPKAKAPTESKRANHITFGPSNEEKAAPLDGALKVLTKITVLVKEFLNRVTDNELAWSYPSKKGAKDFLQALREVKVHEEIYNDAFFFDSVPATKILKFGAPMLNPLIQKKDRWLEKFVVIFLLHECYHVFVQNLYSENYRGIGRADTVLEEVDFYADAFAMGVAARYFAKEKDQTPTAAAKEMISTSLEIFALFDRPTSGEAKMKVLAERRLRRYLIWNAMLLRLTITGKIELADLQEFFTQRVVVQLATLKISVDTTQEVIVEEQQPEDLDLHISVNALYAKFPSQTNYKAGKLIDFVRSFKMEELQQHLSSLVAQNNDILRFK